MISFASEGATWASQTITWSFVGGGYGAGGSTPFSSGLNAAEQAVVEQAMAQWSAVSGLNLVELPAGAAASADIQIGFGALSGAATGALAGSDIGGEIGETDWRYADGHLLPGVAVRFEDPALQPLVAGVGGALTYSGTQTTLYQVALHEIGHALGLAHSADPSAVMNEDVGPGNAGLDASDIAGIEWLYPSAAAAITPTPAALALASIGIGAQAAASAAPGTRLGIPGGGAITFGSAALEAVAANLLAPLIGGTTPITWVEPGAGAPPSTPVLPTGQTGLLVSQTSGAVALGGGYVGAIALDSAAAGTLEIAGGLGDGQAIVAGSADIGVTSGLGGGSLVAGDGNDSFAAASWDDPWHVVLGAGRDTAVTGGQDTVTTSAGSPGLGHAELFLGSGRTLLVSGGQDTVVGGGGTDTVFAAGNALVYGGGGSLTLVDQGADTLVGGAGQATVFGAAADGDVIYGGAGGLEFVDGAGRVSVIGGSGALTVFATGDTGGGLIQAGGGAAHLYAGENMLVEAGRGPSTITGATGTTIELSGNAASEVVLGDGAETIDAASASGANVLFAGVGADLIFAGLGQDTVFAGSGQATLVGGASTVFEFYAAAAPGNTVIDDFNPATDHLLLGGFAAGADAALLHSAQPGGAGLTLTLPNGSTVLLTGIHSLAPNTMLA